MLARVPWTPPIVDQPKPKRLAADQRKALADRVAKILAAGEPTPFSYEGACRHGVRAALCMDGWPWAKADVAAGDVLEAALHHVGAKRPTWQQGQPEYTQEGFSPVERTWCLRCAAPLNHTELRNGWQPSGYCSNLCRNLDKAMYERSYGKRRSSAEYWAAMSVQGLYKRSERERKCEWCAKPFIPRTIVGNIRHCSKSCGSRSAQAKQRVLQPCAHCGNPYNARAAGAGKNYCSRACFDAVYRIKPKPCEYCGQEMTPKDRRTRFCSQSCSAKWRCEALGSPKQINEGKGP